MVGYAHPQNLSLKKLKPWNIVTMKIERLRYCQTQVLYRSRVIHVYMYMYIYCWFPLHGFHLMLATVFSSNFKNEYYISAANLSTVWGGLIAELAKMISGGKSWQSQKVMYSWINTGACVFLYKLTCEPNWYKLHIHKYSSLSNDHVSIY